MYFFSTLQKATECVGLFLFPLSIFLLLIFYDRHKKVILFLLFIVFFWRANLLLKASRYLSILIIISIFLVCLSYSRIHFKWRKIIIVLLFATIIQQILRTYISFNNIYIEYIKDNIAFLFKQERIIIVPDKEKERITQLENSLINTDINLNLDYNSLNEFNRLDVVFLGKKIYVITKESTRLDQADVLNKRKTISMLSTNRNGKKKIIIHDIDKRTTPEYNLYDSTSLIKNGDIELIEKKDTTVSKLKKWIENGCGFYLEDNTFLPQNTLLLTSWGIPTKPYPLIFVSSQDKIAGKYSLHIKTFTPTNLYFFNRINPFSKGELSFLIKNLNRDLIISLEIAEYNESNSYIKSKCIKRIVVQGNDIEQFRTIIDSHIGSNVIIYIATEASEFLLDNICYKAF